MQKPDAHKTDDGENPPENQNRALSETIRELGDLLRRYPIKIINTAKRTGIETPNAFSNDQVYDRISYLIFRDPDCTNYLEKHPQELIDGGNFYHE